MITLSLLKSKFETIHIIGKIFRPILFCRSERDELIPKIQMDTLYNSATGASFKRYYTIKEGSHNDGFRTDVTDYANAILKFVDECNEYYDNKNKINKEGKRLENIENNDFSCAHWYIILYVGSIIIYIICILWKNRSR